MQFELRIQPTGKNTAYTVLSQGQVDAIRGEPGRGRVNIILRFDDHAFRTSISIYNGEWMFVVNKAMRSAGLLPDATYSVDLVRDLEPRRAKPAPDLLAALAGSKPAQNAWARLAPSYQRQHIQHIEGAKRPETRERRIQKLVDLLSS